MWFVYYLGDSVMVGVFCYKHCLVVAKCYSLDRANRLACSEEIFRFYQFSKIFQYYLHRLCNYDRKRRDVLFYSHMVKHFQKRYLTHNNNIKHEVVETPSSFQFVI